MKYLLTLTIALVIITNTLFANNYNVANEECYQIAVHQMLNGNYEGAIESFEMVLAANQDALAFADKTIEYADRIEGDFIEDGKSVYYSILAKNQAALWNFFYEDFSNAEYEIYKYFEIYGDEILGWYALGDYYLTCSYFPDRQLLKSYNSETIDLSFFKTSLDCLVEDARYAFQRCTDFSYGEATIQYFATVLYDDCLIDDFYEKIDIDVEEEEFGNSLLGSLIKN